MSKRLYMSLILSNLVMNNTLSSIHRMYNLYKNSSKYLRFLLSHNKLYFNRFLPPVSSSILICWMAI